MKAIIFTSNQRRHKFVANSLSSQFEDFLVISEQKPSGTGNPKQASQIIQDHFIQREKTETSFFPSSHDFNANTLSIKKGEINNKHILEKVIHFNPDCAFVFGSSIIKAPLLETLPTNLFINLHLGLSPYYRGTGTNFWPFINNELHYIGATLLHIDAGVDTGDIIAHVRPTFDIEDDVHSVGCKVIRESVNTLSKVIDIIKEHKPLPRKKQWQAVHKRYYRRKDFSEKTLLAYKQNLKNNIVENYIKQSAPNIQLCTL